MPRPRLPSGVFDQQPVLIFQQAIAVAQPPVLADLAPEKLEELTTVAVLQEDLLTGVAASAHVIDGACEFNPQWPRHQSGH
jgi:hypothetical protein